MIETNPITYLIRTPCVGRILPFLFFILIYCDTSGQCRTQYFRTQEALDSFAIRNPGCTQIIGNLSIGHTIQDLKGLTQIKSVSRHLSVWSHHLENLKGLDNLEFIGGNLDIRGLSQLKSLEGLEHLNLVAGDVKIEHNPQLNTLKGLSGLIAVTGDLFIGDNTRLWSSDGCDNLVAVHGSLTISGNPIQELEGFMSLKSVGQDLLIGFNHQLESLSGIRNLQEVGGEALFIRNHMLQDLRGFNVRRVKELHISTMKSLKSLTGLEKLKHVEQSLRINNCDSLRSAKGLDDLEFVGRNFEISSNPSFITLSGLKRIDFVGNDFVLFGNASLRSITGYSGPIQIAGTLRINGNESLTNCRAHEWICDHLAQGGKLIVTDNTDQCTQARVEADCRTINLGTTTHSSFEIWPNPVTKHLHIESSETKVLSLEIRDQFGSILINRLNFTTQPIIQELGQLKTGVYYLRVVMASGQQFNRAFGKL